MAKPSDDPQFFLAPPPPGRSRESTLRLDAYGRFFHDGEPVEHDAMARALHRWISRHPNDGRFILVNGHDWTYFKVDDAPYFVEALGAAVEDGVDAVFDEGRGDPELVLSDGTRERWQADGLYAGENDALYIRVKHAAAGGPYLAKFRPGAQLELGRWVEDRGGVPVVVVRGRVVRVGTRDEMEGGDSQPTS